MSKIKKFGYTESELFTLTGSDYVGYFNVSNNIAYTGKYTQQVKLNNYSNIQNIVTRSDLFFNRLPTQDFSLTYSLSDFTFQPNEFINSNSFDNKLQKAYTNFLDTYRAGFMASSSLPYNLTAIGKVSATNSTTQFVLAGPNTNSTAVSALSVLSPLITTESKIAYIQGDTTIYNTLIIANSATLMVYKLQNYSTFALTFSSSYIETGVAEYGDLTFNNITSVSNTGNSFYVCDNGRKTVYAYDISSVVQGDRALGYKFNLVDSANSTQGGFVSPTLVGSSENRVYVYDSQTYTVFFYDTNFNIINSYKNASLFTSSTPVCLSYYKLYDELFILTKDLKLVILNSNATPTIIQLSTFGLMNNEVGRKVIFSNSNSDVMYLLTNKNLYKKFVSNVINNIGSYSFVNGVTGSNSTTTGDVLYDISVLENNQNVDDFILYGYKQLLNYNEKTEFNSIIK